MATWFLKVDYVLRARGCESLAYVTKKTTKLW